MFYTQQHYSFASPNGLLPDNKIIKLRLIINLISMSTKTFIVQSFISLVSIAFISFDLALPLDILVFRQLAALRLVNDKCFGSCRNHNSEKKKFLKLSIQ